MYILCQVLHFQSSFPWNLFPTDKTNWLGSGVKNEKWRNTWISIWFPLTLIPTYVPTHPSSWVPVPNNPVTNRQNRTDENQELRMKGEDTLGLASSFLWRLYPLVSQHTRHLKCLLPTIPLCPKDTLLLCYTIPCTWKLMLHVFLLHFPPDPLLLTECLWCNSIDSLLQFWRKLVFMQE